jgi:heat shock protein HslJ
MWAIVALGDSSAPPAGAQGRKATMRLDAGTRRVSGFAGCNRFTGGFVLSGDTLRFGALATTKMYCPDGDALERVVLGLLPRVTTWAIADGRLRLSGFGETLATLAPVEGYGRSVTEVAY